MAIEIVDFPINSMVIFHSYVKLPEGITTIFLWFSYDFPIKPPLLLVTSLMITSPFFSPWRCEALDVVSCKAITLRVRKAIEAEAPEKKGRGGVWPFCGGFLV